MAKAGEGDPRWIVQDREDGRNCNSWHWEEKDCMRWSRERLRELIAGLEAKIEPTVGWAKIHEVSNVKGDVSVTQYYYH